MARLLKDLIVTDVSSVDRGAGVGVKVLLMKRETLEAAMPDTIEDIRKSVAEGRRSPADVHKMLDDKIEKLQRDGETPQQTLSRATDWRSPRYDKGLHELLGLDVELARIGV